MNKFYFDVFNSGKGECIMLNDLVDLISKKLKINPKIQKEKKQLMLGLQTLRAKN